MKTIKAIIAILSLAALITSCSHGITPQEAASKKQRCGRNWIN